ncbi:S-layer homology domain-containing protein [Paenibacillus sp. NPDC058071]|uniref:cadherin-like beta sandwich domain-containing protein n=1 Tax=Paenibacillus sp. NPDC058071 TaxID=3346326 RepID=UPI0036DC4458
MKKIISVLAALTLLLPLIGTLAPDAMFSPVSAAAGEGPLLTSYEIETNAVYQGWATEYTYSLNGTVYTSPNPPTQADWATPSNYFDNSWGVTSWNKVYTYSNFGQISQTNDALSIPSTAAWATISSFIIEGTSFQLPISNTVFRYSVNGTDVLTAANALNIPPNAKWAALADLSNGWTQSKNHSYATYSLSRTDPSVDSLTISSDSGRSFYAKNGDTVTVELQTDIPVSIAIVKIGGVTLPMTGSGTDWSASLVLSSAVNEGRLSLSGYIYAADGAPGSLTSATTDGSYVIFDNSGPIIDYWLSPAGATNQDVTVEVEAEDDASGVKAIKWAPGTQTAAYFATQGTAITDSFTVSENGIYTVYAIDNADNESVLTVTVSGIDRTAPTLSLTPGSTVPTNHNVTITVNAADADSGIEEVRWSATAPKPDQPWPSQEVEDDQFLVESNGTYTVIAFDNAGNETLRQINVSNIMRDKPAIRLSLQTADPIGDKVAVLADASALGNGNAIEVVLWAPGNLPISYFQQGTSHDITTELQFDATANGTYTVYARDLAGNEAIEIIAVDNIRNTNTALASLIALNAGQELSISPAFTSEQLHYTLRLGRNVESITLKAAPADGASSVTVNGAPLAAGDSASVALRAGVNTIRIVVTAALASEQRTYTIEATREIPPTSGGPSSPGSSTSSGSVQNNAFVAKLNGKLVAGLDERHERGADGIIKYDLRLEDAGAIAALVDNKGENVLHIGLNGDSALKIDAVALALSAKAQSQMKERSVRLVLDIGSTIYEIPAGLTAAGGGDAVVQLKVLRKPADAEQLLGGSAVNGFKEWKPKAAGAVISFTSNAASAAGHSLVIALPNGLDAKELRKLAVLLESGADSKSIQPGTVRYDSQEKAVGIAFNAGSTGRAAVLQAEPVIAEYESYINGNSDGSFAPARAVTRAELAALLAKLSVPEGVDSAGGGNTAAFSDVPQTHWAANAIAHAAAAGWVSGGQDGLFRPGDPLTRAELATLLVRWRGVQSSGSAGFPDAASHWASAAIASAEREGWITGYEDGSFRPNRSVSRAEAVAVLNRVLGRPPLAEGGPAWSDVPASHWAAGAIRSASQSFKVLHYLSGEVEPIAVK